MEIDEIEKIDILDKSFISVLCNTKGILYEILISACFVGAFQFIHCLSDWSMRSEASLTLQWKLSKLDM